MLRRRPDGDGTGDGAPAPDPAATPAPDPAPAPAFDPSTFASKEDLAGLQKNLDYLVKMFQEPEDPQPDPSADPDGEVDIDTYVQGLIQREFAPVRPLLDATVKERGEKEMQRIFKEMESELDTDFDHELAERVAQSFLNEHGGDPVKATQEGARYAAKVRQSERKVGADGYKERLSRGPADYDPPVGGGAEKTRAPAKSYDEVIDRWAGETEA